MKDQSVETPDTHLPAIGRALSCRTRLTLLQSLALGEATVGELVERSGSTQPNVSNHLAVLRAAGLVSGRRLGRSVRYALASPQVADLVRALTAVVPD
ncbi:ArsR/SmtB family transcription factor [Streptomyces sp. NPDC052396]|uniref:ArsR/SmtB family transcription factor n=1 Tax=Streptomyces sp. NPDC052396 TaxID=3365689 RepID=UPI0037D17575